MIGNFDLIATKMLSQWHVCKEDNVELSYPKQAANSKARRHMRTSMLAYSDSQR